MNINEVIEILLAEGFEHVADWGESGESLLRAIGMEYVTARQRGSGYPFDFTIQDVRRAVVQLRLNSVIGTGKTYQASKVHNEIRNTAMHHEDGYVIHDGHEVYWTRSINDDTLIEIAFDGTGFVVVPCWIESLTKGTFRTIELQTEED